MADRMTYRIQLYFWQAIFQVYNRIKKREVYHHQIWFVSFKSKRAARFEKRLFGKTKPPAKKQFSNCGNKNQSRASMSLTDCHLSKPIFFLNSL